MTAERRSSLERTRSNSRMRAKGPWETTTASRGESTGPEYPHLPRISLVLGLGDQGGLWYERVIPIPGQRPASPQPAMSQADSPSDAPQAFVRGLFLGRLAGETIAPYPTPDAETGATIDEIAKMVSDWAQETIDPVAIDETKTIPPAVIEGLKELGIMGLTIPEKYGGAGMGQLAYAKVMEALSHRCASTVTVVGAHLGLGTKGLLLYGSDEQKQRWLPDLASGERIAAFALTEANAGSDAGALRTTADRDGDGWRLSGRKVWITNGKIANFFAVYARTPHPTNPAAPIEERPISAFFVPAESPGFSTGAPEDKMGLRGSSTTEVGLEDVRVPLDYRFGPEGEGFKVALNVLNGGRHGLAASCIGQARLARDLARAHALEREQFGVPIARFGMVREMLANMDADIYAMEASTWLVAGLMDRGGVETMLEAACCKMYATDALWRIANDALQITGGTGFMREYPYERILRDARINMIFEGTNQVLRMMLSTQGLRPLVRGEAADTGTVSFAGVHADFRAEAAWIEELVPRLGACALAAAQNHGKAVRSAQHVLRRLSDAATGLFGASAVLARVSAAAEAQQADDHERALARLACRRQVEDARRSLDEEAHPWDDLIEDVARHGTGLE